MKLDELQAKQDEVQKQFDDLTSRKNDAEIELYRLQGEWRLLEEIISKTPAPEPATGQPSGDVQVTTVGDVNPKDFPPNE